MLLLVPSDSLAPRRPDEHFADEANAARQLGHDVAVVDHDALVAGDYEAGVRLVGQASDDAVYRGWMLSASDYAGFEAASAKVGVSLRTSSEEYRTAHEFPGRYEAVREHTPESVHATGSDTDEIATRCFDRLGSGPAVVRDFAKSEKHYWAEAMFIPDLADRPAALRIVRRFVELRGEYLAGGLVFRRFEEFHRPEVRTWWVDGECRLVTPHPDDPDGAIPEPEVGAFAAALSALRLPFITADVVRGENGWRIVEIGDGQVSDRPRSAPPEAVIEILDER